MNFFDFRYADGELFDETRNLRIVLPQDLGMVWIDAKTRPLWWGLGRNTSELPTGRMARWYHLLLMSHSNSATRPSSMSATRVNPWWSGFHLPSTFL